MRRVSYIISRRFRSERDLGSVNARHLRFHKTRDRALHHGVPAMGRFQHSKRRYPAEPSFSVYIFGFYDPAIGPRHYYRLSKRDFHHNHYFGDCGCDLWAGNALEKVSQKTA